MDRLPAGTRLNDVFEIVRFIANGGMGAVYEGVNISSGERTAIKVLLPTLMHDQRSWEMFRREANVLTRLSHPAIVQYRVLAVDTRVGVPYIATEFIDGVSLVDILTGEQPSLRECVLLLTRLAQGLGRAHALGAVHRDLSPDNVLLPNGQIHEAKIIDFGIAKDLDPSTATIIGSGFAGKLGYCAPEQLGDYGQSIGPWTDIYSLGLLIYSFAVGRPAEMGTTLSQAVDRRRRGVDMDALPEELRPLILAMLQPDPAQRLRSMEDVIRLAESVEVDTSPAPASPRTTTPPPPSSNAEPTVYSPFAAIGAAAAAAEAKLATETPLSAVSPSAPAARASSPAAMAERPKRGLVAILIGAVVAAALAIGASAIILTSHKPAHTGVQIPPPAPHQVGADVALARALAQADCTLVQVESLNEARSGSTLVLQGATADPVRLSAALDGVTRLYGIAQLRLEDVRPTPAPMCGAINAVRPAGLRLLESPSALTSAQREYEISRQTDGSLSAKAVITLNPPLLGEVSDVFLLAPDGALTFEGRLSGGAFAPASHVTADTLGDGRTRLTTTIATPGLFGVIAVGHGSAGPLPAATAAALHDLAAEPQARASAAWVGVVNNGADAAPAGSPAVTPAPSPALTAESPPTPEAAPDAGAAAVSHKAVRRRSGPTAKPAAPSEKKDDLHGLY